jgi:predicted Zn finger-like uncharacterized protein
MFTQCPNCSTVYELHARDLTVAQGKVRCGCCASTFNAVLYLSEEAPAHVTTLTGLSAPDLEEEEEEAQEPQAAAEPSPAPPPRAAAAQPAPPSAQSAGSAAAVRGAEAEADFDLGELLPARPGAWTRAGWSLAALLMLLALGAQVAHQWRGELVELPGIAPHLQRVYRALGLELDPRWDITRYAVVHAPEMASAPAVPGTRAALSLAATFVNDAPRPQPFPLIRVTLEDRWGSAVAARDFEPREYLDDALRGESLLAPGEEAHAQLRFADPGLETVGFTLDLCLREAGGGVRCANDAS